jgi:multiple sugar transport system permease protein
MTVTVAAEKTRTASTGTPAPRSTTGRRRSSRAVWYVVCALISLLFVSPLLAVLLASFKSPAEMSQTPPTYLPTQPTLRNFAELQIGGEGVGQFIWNSAVVAVATVLLTVVIAWLAAFGLSRYPFPGAKLIFLLILAAIMVPFQVLLTPLYVVLNTLGLSNSLVGLVLVLTTFQLPFAIFVIRNSFGGIPAQLYEAAAVDGASVGAMLRLTFPLVRPGVITAGLFAFFAAWNEFFAALILLADQEKFTLPVILTTLTNGARGSVDWGILQAGVVVTILPCVVIFLLLQRHYARGLVAGSGR